MNELNCFIIIAESDALCSKPCFEKIEEFLDNLVDNTLIERVKHDNLIDTVQEFRAEGFL